MHASAKNVPRLALALTAAAWLISSASAGAATIGESMLVDRAADTVYIMSPRGIEARAIADGALSWHSTAALRPLELADGKLLAQGAMQGPGSLPLLLLDGNTGQALTEFSAWLPGDVRASVDDGLGQSFTLSSAAGALVWRYDSRVVQGIAPQSDTLQRARVDGVIDVDMGKGAALSSARKAPPQRAANIELTTPLINESGRQFYSSDRQHVLVSVRLEAGDLQRRYRWTLYDLERQRLGSFDAPVSYSPFVVVAGRVLTIAPAAVVKTEAGWLETPLSVRAMGLESGKEIWRAALRDTRYRGPFPP